MPEPRLPDCETAEQFAARTWEYYADAQKATYKGKGFTAHAFFKKCDARFALETIKNRKPKHHQ